MCSELDRTPEANPAILARPTVVTVVRIADIAASVFLGSTVPPPDDLADAAASRARAAADDSMLVPEGISAVPPPAFTRDVMWEYMPAQEATRRRQHQTRVNQCWRFIKIRTSFSAQAKVFCSIYVAIV